VILLEKLNSIINIDLHIHSDLSDYKEEPGYVKNSNIDNIDVLLKKLQTENINMFAITDHNRFGFNLYSKLRETIKDNEKYSNIKKVLPGIEFDVLLEEGKESCHIICIFDDKDDANLKNIETVLLNNGLLDKKDAYYTREKFETILKEIGLDVILIAHQHKHFDTQGGGKRSLSNSVSDVYEFIKTGYISALEYQRPAVQGMIINSLKKVNKNIASIIGSDCHKWECYPKKDETLPNKDYISKIKSLPTFKGLVFALTSIETRFNRIKNNNQNYIKYITCNNEEYELSNGLNAIIGDNGAGKTFLLDLIHEANLKQCYKELKRINNIDKINVGNPKFKYIKQNQIIDDVKEGTLFNNSNTEYYKEITTKDTFKKRIKNYSENLIKYIQQSIANNSQSELLNNYILEIKNGSTKNFVPVAKNDLNILDNLYEDRISALQEIIDNLNDEYNDNKKFYNQYAKDIKNIIKGLQKIIKSFQNKSTNINNENEIKNIIISALDTFNINMNVDRSDKEKEDLQYKKDKNKFCNTITTLIKQEKKERKTPNFPKAISGNTRKLYKGFNFSKQTKYNNQFLEEKFFEELFVKGYDKEKILNINTEDELTNSLSGITKYEDLPNWYKKVDSFIEKYLIEETYIEKNSSKETLGNTPGEISIVFYDFTLNNLENDISVILIDQPEDDISNNKISKQLISYIEQIRDYKQIIIVTHNPLLVVNLDVDNVILVNKNYKKQIEIKSGCLEYENEGEDKYSIINEIAETMDGGKEMIERRFRLYER